MREACLRISPAHGEVDRRRRVGGALLFIELSSVLISIVVCSGLGFFWKKSGQPLDSAFVISFVSNIGFPCLLLSSVARPGLTLGLVAQTFGAVLVAVGCFAALGLLALWALRIHDRRYLPSLMLPNSGNLGIPISYFLMGDEAMIFAVAFSTLIQIGHVTIGTWLVSGSISTRAVARNPMIYALTTALLLIGLNVRLPTPVSRTLSLLGGVTLPLMLFTLGASLAGLRVQSLHRSAALSVVRVGGGLLASVALVKVLRLTPVAAGSFIIQCTMPVAVLSYLLAQKHKGPSHDIAAMVLISTSLSIAALPILVYIVR
jgi:malate permease and related proteins